MPRYAPFHPGASVQWHKHPEYTSSLLDYANSTLTVAELDIVFTNRAANRISKEDKRTRTRLINELAGRVFRGTDYARIRQYQGSVQRRIQSITRDYSDGLRLIDSQSRPRQYYVDKYPWWTELDVLLSGRPEFRVDRGRDLAEFVVLDDDDDGEDDRMSGVEYAPIAGPAPREYDPLAVNRPFALRDRSPPRLVENQIPPISPLPRFVNRPWSPAYERAVSPHRQPSPPPAASPPAAAAVAFAAEHPEDAYCPACNIYLASTVDPTEHLRRCLDDVAGATVLTCPVCDADIGGLRQIERERHIDSCCMTGGETNDKGKERARAYLSFQADDKTLPRDETTREPLECGVCMDDFDTGADLVRLSCYCVFHESCMVEYWSRPGTFCPVHRDDRQSTVEVNMH